MKARSALITAGASGIGAAIAESFIQSGHNVHVADVDSKMLDAFTKKFPQTSSSVCDVAVETQVKDVVESHIKQFVSIDVLVNCTGIAGPTASIEDIDTEDWKRCLDVNLNAMFYFCKAVLPSMKLQKSGSIVNISSTAGWHGYPYRSPYCTSKWGVIGLTKSVAMEVGQYNIRSNCICPGSIEGERMDRVIRAEAIQKNISEEAIRARYTNSNSMRTFINASDIADMAVFLSSPQASKVTGQIMNVDGHLEAY